MKAKCQSYVFQLVAVTLMFFIGSTQGFALDFSDRAQSGSDQTEYAAPIVPSGRLSYSLPDSISFHDERYNEASDEVSPAPPLSGKLTPRLFVSSPQHLPTNKKGKVICTKKRPDLEGFDTPMVGIASWYGNEFHGRKTASGETFDQNAFTLASLTIPMGALVMVKNLLTGKEVRAKVNDCGPYTGNRIADLSKGLAKYLGIFQDGTGPVSVRILQ